MSTRKPQKPITARPQAVKIAAKPTPTSGVSTFSATDYLPLLLTLVVTALAFYPSLSNGFVNWDDEPNLLENKLVMAPFSIANTIAIFTGTVIGNYNPLPIFTFHLEYQLVKFEPFLYHFNNLLLHLVCVFLTFRIMRKLGLSSMAAMFVALFFGIHPMRVESVAWVTERKDVLFAAFFLGALDVYIRQLQNPRPAARYWMLIIPLSMLALFAKIQAVALPLAMLSIDYLLRRPLTLKLVWEKWMFWLMSFAIGALGIYFLRVNESISSDDPTGFGFVDRLFIGSFSYIIYLIKWIIPWKMSPLYPYPEKLDQWFYTSTLPLAGVAILSWVAFRRDWRHLLFAILFFTFNVMFMLQIVGAGQGFLADRFTYIPYLGLFYLSGVLFDWVTVNKPTMKSLVQGSLIAYLSIFGLVTMKQCNIWKSGDLLWGHVLHYYKNVSTPWNNRAQIYRKNGDALREAGKIPEAIVADSLALFDLGESLKLKANVEAYNSRGKILFSRGDIAGAFSDYTNAIILDSVNVSKGEKAKKSAISEILINRAAVWGMQGKAHIQNKDFDAALAKFNLAITDATKGMAMSDTSTWLGYRNRYLAFMDIGQLDKALADQDSVIKLRSFDATAFFDKGVVLLNLKRGPEAIDFMTRAITMLPPTSGQLPGFYRERAKAYYQMGDTVRAKTDAIEAQRRGAPDVPKILL